MADIAEAPAKRPNGRPLLFETPEKLQSAIDAYFKKCDTRKVKIYTKDGTAIDVVRQIPYTISGLALALNTSRETLMDYQERELFSDTIKAAKDKCLAWVEEQLFEGTGAPAGVIFNLKNNWGWVDKTEVAAEHTSPDGSMSPKEPASASQVDELIALLKDKTAKDAQ